MGVRGKVKECMDGCIELKTENLRIGDDGPKNRSNLAYELVSVEIDRE